MIEVDNPDLQAQVEKTYSAKQDHIFRFWPSLRKDQKKNLLDQLVQIDFDLLDRLTDQALHQKEIKKDEVLDPPHVITLQERLESDNAAANLGENALRDGSVAAVLVAGGQGTRLGFDGPKGMYPVTPVKQKSLFHLHCEKLLARGKKWRKQIPWYIMTSLTNYAQTQRYFDENNYFGYDKSNFFLFIQEMIPAIDRSGKLILDQPDHIFMNPNGHGGTIKALWKSGALADMKDRGVDYIFYFQVDNVLTRICDPVYMGYHIQGKSEMSNKVVRKEYPEEKMGILCRAGGKLQLIEYSDLSEQDMYAKNPDGSMKFWVGNIATHIFDRQFLERENQGGFRLPYHLAEKSISYLDQEGILIKPKEKNGIKFETFVFDALGDAKKSVCVEVERSKEFSPLKNKEGENSPQTIRRDFLKVYSEWLENAGHTVPKNAKGEPALPIEISPLASLQGEDLANRSINWKQTGDGIYIE
jgi:UDP-N-acetylglucosamine/UDP-N-acetylgalactosamine diphosphorylase